MSFLELFRSHFWQCLPGQKCPSLDFRELLGEKVKKGKGVTEQIVRRKLKLGTREKRDLFNAFLFRCLGKSSCMRMQVSRARCGDVAVCDAEL